MSDNQDTREIFLENIDEPAAAMRTDISRDEVFELAADIKKNGLINPITVRPRGDRFEVVAGHRRYLAHRYGGIPKMRCIVRELSDDEAFAIMTSENLKRENVNPADEAVHVQRLMQMHNGDIGKVAHIVGRSEGWVNDRMTIALMPELLRAALRAEKIKIGVALALSEITDETDLGVALDMAIQQGMSNVMARVTASQWAAGIWGHTRATSTPDPNEPGRVKHVVMFRCAIDGKEYSAAEFNTVFVHVSNMQYITAMHEHLKTQSAASPSAPVEDEVLSVS